MTLLRATILFILFFFSQQTSGQDELELILSEATRSDQHSEFLTSIDLYQKCLEIDSTYLDCRLGKAQAYFHAGDWYNAKIIYHKLESDSLIPDQCDRALASIYEMEENIPLAIKYYTSLVKRDTANPYYFRKLAQQYDKAGLLPDAFKLYSQAYKHNSLDNFTIQGLVEIFLSNKQSREADSLLQIALKRDSTNVKFNLLAARSQYLSKDFSQVCKTLSNTSKIIDLPNYYAKLLGYAYMQIDSLDRAIFFLQKSLNKEASPEYAEYYLAVAHEKKKDTVGARYFYTRALKSAVSENSYLYHRQLGYIARENKEMKEAITHLEASYRYQNDSELLFHLAMLYDEYYEDKSVAINAYQRYLKSGITTPELKKYADQRWRYLRSQSHMKTR